MADRPETIAVRDQGTGEISHAASVGNANANATSSAKSDASAARLARYEKFLAENNDDVSGVISREATAAAREKLRADSVKDKDKLEQIDEEKRAFVKSLFEKESAPASRSRSSSGDEGQGH